MSYIDELIADAKATEEVEKEQEKAAKDKAFRDELKEALKDSLVDTVIPSKNKVEVPLEEYVLLRFKERDLLLLLDVLTSDFELGYNKESLRLKSYAIAETFRVLYPDVYNDILEELKAEERAK